MVILNDTIIDIARGSAGPDGTSEYAQWFQWVVQNLRTSSAVR